MLNISENTIDSRLNPKDYHSFHGLHARYVRRSFSQWMLFLLLVLVAILFLPWTQNVSLEGELTSLSPSTRPQTIHTTIPGRIEKWYVVEGDSVKKGDTIVYITEIKDSYFDPNLLARTREQLDAKQGSIGTYTQKADALARQADALRQALKLKTEQLRNKVQQSKFKIAADSTEYEAARRNLEIAKAQYDRYKILFDQNLKSRTQLEEKELKVQETQAKMISAQNKFLNSQNELMNARIELDNVVNEYNEKITKTESDRFSAISSQFEAQSEVAKLSNTLANYNVRSSYHYITAPQDGYIVRALRAGIGETVKEGEEIVSILPKGYTPAVEMFISPMDLPLIRKGQVARLQFDGWPAIVFSGWPQASYGTFSGRVFAIDRVAGTSGKYRVLISPDSNDAKHWPSMLQPGSGVKGFAMLKDVPIWYELWRQINGFPADFYQEGGDGTGGKKKGKEEKKKEAK